MDSTSVLLKWSLTLEHLDSTFQLKAVHYLGSAQKPSNIWNSQDIQIYGQ